MLAQTKELTRKSVKALRLIRRSRYRTALLRGVAATIEHEPAFREKAFRTVLDVGANRGQFAVFCREMFPQARIFAFEPLQGPLQGLRNVVAAMGLEVQVIPFAIGQRRATAVMHVSRRDDSSSLLPISTLQTVSFPGTEEAGTETVEIAPLEDFLVAADLSRPCLLKIDVQGYELHVLEGCATLLSYVDAVYVEASFLPLYEGQALATEVISYLFGAGFSLSGVYNLTQACGTSVQADFLFQRVA